MHTIEQLPTYDLTTLAGIEANARRSIEAGTAAESAEAEALLFAIYAERKRHRRERSSQGEHANG